MDSFVVVVISLSSSLRPQGWPPYYCTPLVCSHNIQAWLAVWQFTHKQTNESDLLSFWGSQKPAHACFHFDSGFWSDSGMWSGMNVGENTCMRTQKQARKDWSVHTSKHIHTCNHANILVNIHDYLRWCIQKICIFSLPKHGKFRRNAPGLSLSRALSLNREKRTHAYASTSRDPNTRISLFLSFCLSLFLSHSLSHSLVCARTANADGTFQGDAKSVCIWSWWTWAGE